MHLYKAYPVSKKINRDSEKHIKAGHFQSTTTLYKAYCEDTPQNQVVTETAVVQQIEQVMSALKLNPAKSRFNF